VANNLTSGMEEGRGGGGGGGGGGVGGGLRESWQGETAVERKPENAETERNPARKAPKRERI